MHIHLLAEDFRTDHGILGKIFGNPAPDHQQAGRPRLDLDLGQFAEIGNTVDAQIPVRVFHLMLDQAEACRTVGEGRYENRHIIVEAGLDQGVSLDRVGFQPAPHLHDELTRRIRSPFQLVRDNLDHLIAMLKLFLVDIGVIDTVDVKRPQDIVINAAIRLIMTEAQRFEKIHIDDGGAGGHNRVHHAELHHIAIDMHASPGGCGTRQGQDDGALLILDGHVEDFRRPRKVARGEGHLAHGVDDRPCIKGPDIDMFDRLGKKGRLIVTHAAL